jgi:hypothetical protein
VAFNSPETCEAARLSVINDTQRVRQDEIDHASQSVFGQDMAVMAEMSAPTVSAVCVAQ